MSEQILQQDSEMVGVATASAPAIDCSNADMVDGKHAADFATAAQGAKADVALLYKGGVISDTDADTLETGIYSVFIGEGTNNKNFPPNFRYGAIQTFSAYYATQMAYEILSEEIYIRTRKESGWSSWKTVLTNANFNPDIFAKVDTALVRSSSDSIKADETAKTMCGFGYTRNGFPLNGGFISFGGFDEDEYQTQLQGNYNSGNELFFRTKNDDAPKHWNEWHKIWHEGNLPLATFATAAQGTKADSAMQPSRIKVQAAQPTDPQEGDIWIKS